MNILNHWGHLSLYLALACAVIQTLYAAIGKRGAESMAWRALYLHSLLLFISGLGLIYAFITNDFSLKVVAQHSHIQLPIFYKITAIWAGHEGSIWLWAFVGALIATTTCHQARKRVNDPAFARPLLCLFGLLQTGFVAFCLFTSNPYTPAPFQIGTPYTISGASLNPLLQDPMMAIHPPILYLGYVGLMAPCVLALTYLYCAKSSIGEVVFFLIQKYLLIAWAFLTLGIALGSFWAYRELGWGGVWFWDPVENASLMPWLLAVANIHLMRARQTNPIVMPWAILMAIVCFCWVLIGTFTVRSGLLDSVHAFNSAPKRAIVLLSIIALFCIGSSLFFILRFHWLNSATKSMPISNQAKYFLLLSNALLFLCAWFTVALGTLTPIFYKLFTHQEITVGAPYFNSFAMCFVLFVLLSLITLHVNTRSKKIVVYHLVGLCVISLCTTWLVHSIFNRFDWLTTIITALCAHAFLIQFFSALTKKKWAVIFAHSGFIFMCFGLTFSSNFGMHEHHKMHLNEPFNIAGRSFTWVNVSYKTENGIPRSNLMLRLKEGAKESMLSPERRFYPKQNTTTTEVDIHSTLLRDIYVVLGEQTQPNEWIIHVQYKPMIRWVWLGALAMIFGGLWAAIKQKRKHHERNA